MHPLYTHQSADGGHETMNMKELVSAVSTETNLPAAQVRQVTAAVLQEFAELIENKGKLTSSAITIAGVVRPANLPQKTSLSARSGNLRACAFE